MIHTTGTRVVFAEIVVKKPKRLMKPWASSRSTIPMPKWTFASVPMTRNLTLNPPLTSSVKPLSPEYMDIVNQDRQRAYVVYYFEEA